MTSDYSIHDGADVPDCTKVDEIQWTYNNGQFLVGSAYMYNYVCPFPMHLTTDKRRSILEKQRRQTPRKRNK
jgi:hypothetical protein